MFIDNKYTKIYSQIISRAAARDHNNLGLIEWHHAIPKSLGGKANNKVALTLREHLICHLLLVKMLSGKPKRSMGWALHRMLFSENAHQHRHKASSHTYAHFRKSFYEDIRGKKRIISEKHRTNIIAANKLHKTGKTLSEQHRTKMSKAKINRQLSASHRAAIGIAHSGKIVSQTSRDKISASLKGRKQTPESKAKLSASMKKRWADKKLEL